MRLVVDFDLLFLFTLFLFTLFLFTLFLFTLRVLMINIQTNDGDLSRLEEIFRKLRMVDLFLADSSVRNVNFLRDEVNFAPSSTSTFPRQKTIDDINASFDRLAESEFLRSKNGINPPEPMSSSKAAPAAAEARIKYLETMNRALRTQNCSLSNKVKKLTHDAADSRRVVSDGIVCLCIECESITPVVHEHGRIR